MRFQFALLSGAILVSSIPTPAITSPLQPNDGWQVDYGQTQCVAARSFGGAASPTQLAIVPSFSGRDYTLMVTVPQQGPEYAKQMEGTVDFGHGPVKSGVLYFGAKGIRQSAYQYRVSAEQMRQAASAQALTLRSGNNAYEFALSNMPALLDNLTKCTGDLEQYWNMGSKEMSTFAKASVRDLATLFTPKDFPLEVKAGQADPKASFQILVDEKGAVVGCDVMMSSGAPAMDATGCDLLKQRAKFTPAKNAAGAAVRSVVTTVPLGWDTKGSQPFQNGCFTISGGSTINNCGDHLPKLE